MYKILLMAVCLFGTTTADAQKAQKQIRIYIQSESDSAFTLDTVLKNAGFTYYCIDSFFTPMQLSDSILKTLKSARIMKDSAHVFMFKHQDWPDKQLFKSFIQVDSLFKHNEAKFFSYQFDINDSLPESFPHAFSINAFRTQKQFKWETLDEMKWKKTKSSISPALLPASSTLSLQDLKLFPELGDGRVQLSFKLPTNSAKLSVQLVNASGHTLYANQLSQEQGLQLFELDLRNTKSGDYYLIVTHGKARAVKMLRIH